MRGISVRPHWNRALALGFAALAIRLLVVAVAGRDSGVDPSADAFHYDKFARLMMSGWHWVTTPLAIREPLYPAFMAFSYVLPGGEYGTLQVVQAIIGAAAVAVVYLAFRSLIGEAAALLAAAFVALNPHMLGYTPEPLRENLIIPLLVGFLGTFYLAVEKTNRRRLFYCMLFFVLLVHTDVRFLPLVVTIPLMALAYHGRLRLAVRQTLWMLLFFVVLMTPYQIRSSVALGEPVIVTTRFLGKWLDRAAAVASQSDESEDVDRREAWLREFEASKMAGMAELSPEEQAYFGAGGRPLTERLQVHAFLAVEYWRFARLKHMYRPYPDGRFVRPWSLVHIVSSSLVVIPFFVFLPFLWRGSTRASRRVAWPLLIFLFAHFLMHVLVHSRERYRVPMEVVIAILLSIALVNAWALFRRRLGAGLREGQRRGDDRRQRE